MSNGVTAVQVSYLCHRPDFRNGPGGYSNNDRILVPRRLFEFDSNNRRPQAILILCFIAVHVPHLCFPGCCHIWPRATNLTLIMAKAGTRIMAAFLPPSVCSSPTRIMASPQAIPIFCQTELHQFMSPTYGFLAGAISGQGLQA